MEYGGSLGWVDITSDDQGHTYSELLALPEIGASVSACTTPKPDVSDFMCGADFEDNKKSSSDSIYPNIKADTLTIGLRNLGVSISSNQTCVNLGIGLGFPINISGTLETFR